MSEEATSDPALSGMVLEHLEAPLAAFLSARAGGRLHHAWLFTGPQGLGKAALAHRLARLLLGAKPDPALGVAASRSDDPVNRLIEARSHPDFILLNRVGEDGKAKKTISVDEARRLPDFFSKAPALSPYRVAIIDAAEDMNVNAANAVLKTLEEPPPRGVVFLISHAPGKLLPTIRSRCRKLDFRPWDDAELAEFLQSRFSLSPEEAATRAALAQGSPGRAMALSDGEAVKIDAAARALLEALPGRADALIVNLADGFRGGQGMERFSLFIERLADHISRRVRSAEDMNPAARAAWSQAWTSLVNLPAEAEGINLDRADALVATTARLGEVARRFPLF